MKFRNFHLFPLLAMILLVFACKSKTTLEDFQIDKGFDYFPLEIGKYKEFTVDSITYDTTGMGIIIEETTTFVREEVIDTFSDNINRLTYKVERFERKSEQENWKIHSVSYIVPTENEVEVVENNLRFIKMVFPLQDGDLWDGNQYIDPTTIVAIKGETVEVFKSWSYEVQSLGDAEVINNIAFDEVATLTQAESENVIELRLSTEKYARGVGLIYREMKILDTQCIDGCEGKPWEDKAQKGFILRQWITDFN